MSTICRSYDERERLHVHQAQLMPDAPGPVLKERLRRELRQRAATSLTQRHNSNWHKLLFLAKMFACIPDDLNAVLD